MRNALTEATRDVQVRLDPPQASILSTFHYVNLGGAEFIVYRATPADVESGVRVGDRTYPGFPATAIGVQNDPALHVAFFALSYDQDVNTPISVFATDPAGNTALAAVDHMAFTKPFSRSTIPIDNWVARVVPPIVANTPEMQLSQAPEDVVQTFVRINGDLRRQNAQTIAALAKKTAPEMMWKEPFQPLGNAAVEAKFADFRTYTFMGKEIDRQVHLGFDLAVTQHVPIPRRAAGRRRPRRVSRHLRQLRDHRSRPRRADTLRPPLVDWCEAGRQARKGAGHRAQRDDRPRAGDHLHFHRARQRHAVNPVEWWDIKWMQDRVFRKVRDAGGSVT
jgi:hypothetical protein